MVYRVKHSNILTYSPDRVYLKGEKCVFRGAVYICNKNNSVSQIPLISKDWDSSKKGI